MIRYTQDHEWVRREDDGTFTVGITQHAQDQLGDLVFVELPEVGRRLEPGESAAVVESTKAASDVYAPLGGTVVAINPGAAQEPSLLNVDPTGKGWLYRLRADSDAEFESLLSADDYAALLSSAE